MHWRTNKALQTRIALAALLLTLIFLVWLPASAANAQQGVLGLAAPGTATVQATPTEDATVAVLNKEKLIQEVDQQQRTLGNWVWSNAAAILSSFLSTLVVVIGALLGYRQWRVGRKDAQDRELEDRKAEREKQAEEQKRSLEDRAEERFQAAVAGLGDDKESVRIGAAILLRTFLREEQGYEQFYVQTFDLAVANLRLSRILTPSDDPDGLPHPPQHANDTPLPLTTLSQALIVAFKEAFPLAREWLTQHQPAFTPQTLDATSVQLDNAYLTGADLKYVWMPRASIRGANLGVADLSGADLSEANLREANLRGANLREANLRGADLRGADLRGADLTGAHLLGANLSGANLGGADLRMANLDNAILLGANLSGAHLFGANLSGANLGGADLRMAHLTGAHLLGANLSGANLGGADLRMANLDNAILLGANLSGADLRTAKLYGVRGLTREQLEADRAKGAILEEEPTANSSQAPET